MTREVTGFRCHLISLKETVNTKEG